jgi:hypothetical protein
MEAAIEDFIKANYAVIHVGADKYKPSFHFI